MKIFTFSITIIIYILKTNYKCQYIMGYFITFFHNPLPVPVYDTFYLISKISTQTFFSLEFVKKFQYHYLGPLGYTPHIYLLLQ